MNLNLQVVISYSDIFDDDPPEISDLLKGIPSIIAIQIVVHYLTQIHMDETGSEQQFEFIKQWTGRQDDDLKKKIYQVYKRYSGRFNFINNISCLFLVQEILENFNDKNAQELTPDQELDLFKAYLVSSKEWIEKSTKLLDNDREYKKPDEVIELVLPSQLPIHELKYFKDFRLQFYKAIEFFNFCQKNELFKDILAEFLKSRSQKSWEDYLGKIITAYMQMLDKASNRSVLEISNEEVADFFSLLSLDPSSYSKKIDFLNIRERPVLNFDSDKYLFLNLNFLIDKIFQGIQFDIFGVIKNEKLKGGVKYNNFPDFKSQLSEDFTEKYLFKNLVEEIFCKNCTHIPEENFTGQEINPDYYIRRKTKVFLFEFKDILFSATSKNSYDITTIQKELFKKLVENDQGKPKGIKQLLNNIEALTNKGLPNSDPYDFSQAKFYPILVVTDRVFNQFGFNYLIKKEFDQLLKKSNIPKTHRVKEPVIVLLDDLIKFKTLFENQELKINSIFDSYNGYTNAGGRFRILSSFSDYIHQRAKEYEITPTGFIEEKLDNFLNT